MAAILLVFLTVVQQKDTLHHRDALRHAKKQLLILLPRLPLGILLAHFLGVLIPPSWITAHLGQQASITGLGLAVVGGALIPGGPMITFPLALQMVERGAGPGSVVTFCCSWALLAWHRALVFEIPMLGWEFTLARYVVCLPLPIFAGIAAQPSIIAAWF